jgi:hypothetical protein
MLLNILSAKESDHEYLLTRRAPPHLFQPRRHFVPPAHRSDAYQTRALAYRKTGKTELAEADEKKDKELDDKQK